MRGGFFFDLGLAHLVQRLDGHFRVLGAVFDIHHPTAGFEGTHHAFHHLVGKRQLVVHIDHDRQVNACSRQIDVVHRGENRLDVGQICLFRQVVQHLDHFGLYIDRHHHAATVARTDEGCDAAGVIAGARADVGHHHARPQPKLAQQQVAPFFFLAFFTLQPGRALPAHHARDFASKVAFADAVGAGPDHGVPFRLLLGMGCGASPCASGGKHQHGQPVAQAVEGEITGRCHRLCLRG